MNDCIDRRLYYAALMVCLTLPDICAGLSLPRDAFVKQVHYIDFLDSYADERALGLDAASCYLMRCGIVHRGNAAASPHSTCTHVIFNVPESGGFMHRMILSNHGRMAQVYNLKVFCSAMESAVFKWWAQNSSNDAIARAVADLLYMRPHGVSGLIGGLPVLACGPE
jgi:hypothetical protein